MLLDAWVCPSSRSDHATGNHRNFYLAMTIIIATIASIQVGAYYSLQNSNTAAPSSSLQCSSLNVNNTSAGRVVVNTVFGFGNGTAKWYNHTSVPSNWNAYEVAQYVTGCRVQSTFYGPPLNEHLVTGILGVSAQGSKSWNLWTFCQSANAWVYSTVGADLIPVSKVQIIGWAYEVSSSGTNSQPPIPTERSVDSCP